MDREKLLQQVTVLGFMAVDLQLFLNTHPNDGEALAMYNEVVSQEGRARRAYEDACGPLNLGGKARGGWQWPDCPWPWQEAFNHADPCGDAWKAPYGKEVL